jgi:hypothetical protein
MKLAMALLLFLPACLSAAEGRAAELARLIRETSLDQQECYRVRDLRFAKEDVRFYLTDGYLIFGKPVDGLHLSAVFTTEVGGGDAEMLLFPPSRGERLSIAKATGSPTFNEHFKLAVMIFTDDTYQTLYKQIHGGGAPRKSLERGVLMEQQWTSVVRNLISSFEMRVLQDLLGARRPSSGFFYAGIGSNRLGNFDVVYDPRASEQITIGQVALRDNRSFFDVWTSFKSRSFRNGTRKAPVPQITISNVRLDATLEPDLQLKVKSNMIVTPSESGLPYLVFDLSRRMRVEKALINGMPAEVFQHESVRSNLIRGKEGNGGFLLIPQAELESGRQYEVEVRLEGNVVSDAGNRVYYVGSRANWYPNWPTHFAQYDVTFRYPKDLDLVAAGEIVEQRTEGEWQITRRKTRSPVRFYGFNLGEYERLTVRHDQYTVEVCANRRVEPALQPKPKQMIIMPPSTGWPRSPRKMEQVMTVPVEQEAPNPAARLHELATEIGAAFEFMAAHFGPPPLPHLTISPIPGTFGQGFPGLIYLSTLSYLAPKEFPQGARSDFQQMFFSEILHAHETAHQWWGNVVTSVSYRDEWLMEALANYSALMYLEQRKGPDVLNLILAEYKKDLLKEMSEGRLLESTGPIVWGIRLQSSQAPEAWRTITYEKGSWILHMLRRRMGDDRFMSMLGELRRRYEYKAVSTEEFCTLAAEFLPPESVDRELENFFENWVYSTGIPTLQFKDSVRGKEPSVTVSGTLTQSGVAKDFSIWVPIEIQFPGGKTRTQWVLTDEEPVSFQLSLRERPLKIVLDPHETVLAAEK